MKKIVFLAIISLIVFSACKKDRTCSCTYTIVSKTSTQPGYNFPIPPATTSVKTYSKIKKNSEFVKNCITQDITETSNQGVYNAGVLTNYVITTVTKNECDLK